MRIVVAEDSLLLREGLVGLLEQVGHEVVHVTDNADELVRTVLADGAHGALPDLVITDVRMSPGLKNDGIDPEIVPSLLHGRSSPLDTLTPREREVLGLMAEGRSNPEIAERLVVSGAAVAKHIGNVFAKLGLTTDETGHRRVHAVLAYLRG